MKQKKLLLLKLTALLLITSAVTSCKKTKENPVSSPTIPNTNINYALMVTSGSATQTAYIFGQEGFPSGTISTSNAAELTGYGFLNTYGGFCYGSTFGAPATMRKYAFDDNGKPQQVGAFAIPGLNTFASVYFISPTEAYATTNGLAATPILIQFNPTNMLVTNSIDLTDIQKSNAPKVFYQGLVHRDNLLYMGVKYIKGDWSLLSDSTYIVVINRNTLKVKKLLTDGRTGTTQTAGTKDSYIAPSMIIDENNDIYVIGLGNGTSVPSGVLKIKNGETDFDPTYFFNLTSAVGGDCLGLMYYGNSKAFTLKAQVAANYPYEDSSLPPSYKYHKIDLMTKTSQGDLAGISDIFNAAAFAATWDTTKVYLNVPAASTNEMYSFDRSTGVTAKVFTSASGVINGFAKLK